LIAGGLSLPAEVFRLMRDAGSETIVMAGFEGETDPGLMNQADESAWLKVGQLGRMIRFFKDHGVDQCIMAGRIAPRNLFDVRPDLRGAAMLWRLKERNAHTIFGGIADELQKDGIELIEAVPWLGPIMPAAGYQSGAPTQDTVLEDVRLGCRMAKEVSRLEIGQSVVVKQGTVLAVEGFEGTDACLERGGALAGRKGGAVGVKVAKAGHDMRFDIPCIGMQTINRCLESGFRALAFEASKIILLEKEAIEMRLQGEAFSLLAIPESKA
jgi:DUF1009 family protein